MFPNVDKSEVREGKTKTNIEKTKQKLLRKNLLVLTKAQVQQDHPKTSRKCDQDCGRKWSKLQKLWNRTDQVIQTIVTHTKKDPRPHKQIKLDGKEAADFREGWNNLSDKKDECQDNICKADVTRMLQVIKKMSTPAMGKMRELTGNIWNGKTGEAERQTGWS